MRFDKNTNPKTKPTDVGEMLTRIFPVNVGDRLTKTWDIV